MRRPPIYSAVFSLPAAFALSLFMWGCGTDGRAAWLDLEPGDPIPGLSDEQRESFERGLALFSRVHTPEDGLGPIFEASACNACHTHPASGGVATDEAMYVLRASRWSEEEGCDLLLEEGGDFVRQRAVPHLQSEGIHGDRIPEGPPT